MGLLVHACNPSIWEAGAQGQLGLNSDFKAAGATKNPDSKQK